MMLIKLALAPVLILLFYIFIRDKYEKEPVKLLLTGLLLGVLSTGMVLGAGSIVLPLAPEENGLALAFFSAFISSAGIEEAVKFILLYFLIWRTKEFNEPFDGIVYAVFISLGFAAVENVLYVLDPFLGGLETAFSRAFLAVPGHMLFGVFMGYYMGFAKFEHKGISALILSFAAPFSAHAVYNLTIELLGAYYLLGLLPLMLFFWRKALKKMYEHLMASPFKN